MTEFSILSNEGGTLHKKKSREINQDELTQECWIVQVWGLDRCGDCEYFGTDKKPHKECGGKLIRRTGKNMKGFTVPLGSESATPAKPVT